MLFGELRRELFNNHHGWLLSRETHARTFIKLMDGGIAPGSEATGGEDSVQVDREVASDGESLEGDSNKVKEVDSMEE